MLMIETEAAAQTKGARSRRGAGIEVHDVAVVRRGRRLLHDVDLSIEPGELVAVVGASGAGKSTLLDAIAGIRAPTTGTVDFVRADDQSAPAVGYVPQEDLIHRDLQVAETLRYAGRLRLGRMARAELDRAVDDVLAELGLTDRAAVRVGDLSGGQRKHVSIAVELLADPSALFLDEPTSGLDPGTAAALMATLRRLADAGTTVVLTTHNMDDLRACDRAIVVAGGRVTFVGHPAGARHALDGTGPEPTLRPEPVTRSEAGAAGSTAPRPAGHRHDPHPTGVRQQWAVLTSRNLGLLRRNRLTLAIMLAAPAAVIAMFALLFRSGAFDPGATDRAAAISTTYWLAFAAFFFGLTYGLLQICTELPIVRREVFLGVRIWAYLAAKVTVLTPVLGAVNVAMLVVLRAFGRLPALDAGSLARLGITLLLISIAALALGLLASAVVADPGQATLALPMLCFPAVLFAGAVLPVASMGLGGRAISTVMVARWGFEAAGHDLGLASLLASDHSGQGVALLAQYRGTFEGGHVATLLALTAASLVAGAAVLRSRTRTR